MRYVLTLWATPLALFWGWFGLSFYDINFGYVMLSRRLHDLVFQLYGEMLGIDPATIPMLIAKACVFDSLILAGIFAFRRRRQIGAWIGARRRRYTEPASPPSA
ncbi:hypothetical protein C7441_102237 [Pseudaminobacter salicylatoxidans]|uniref:Uncharacterized protein n=1 Tax=Pseudaminobacter salicylatoxidans TaxID=93369 RepID=A0A316C7S7_PSESE|nr:DUF6105 family protein [Pseudaminobacter salicylatoxidans]PWJ85791.1 hypothetical protein C7441_102237 [Pseudaminobacter salicylatoxidans]